MVRVAAYQAYAKSTLEARQKQIHEALSRADEERIDFICFPEGFLTGYYAEKELAKINSLEISEDRFQNWLDAIRHYHVTIIIGFNEREGDLLFDSVAIIEQGKLLGIQRKHHLYHTYFTSGTNFLPFWSKGICIGIIVCLDAMYFEPSRLLALQGATILFCPMCNKVPLEHPYAKRPPYYSHFVARSFENRCWLIAADWIWAPDSLICPGNSVIYDPNGREIIRSREFQEDLLIFEIPQQQLFSEKGRRFSGSPILSLELTKLKDQIFAIRD